MDKETLSNYGWIAICVLVLAVMIAFATPFGNFIANGIKSTTQGLFDTNQKALNSTGLINILDKKFDFEQSGIIPTGGIYTTFDGTVLTEGDEFPTPQSGDIYNFGDYEYCYNYYLNGYNKKVNDKIVFVKEWSPMDEEPYWYEPHVLGWGMYYIGNDIAYPTAPIDNINGQPITSAIQAYSQLTNIVKIPKLPDTITNLSFAFCSCESLKEVTNMPNNLTDVSNAFSWCSVLEIAPDMDNCKNLKSAAATFAYCESLKTVPKMPETAYNLDTMFQGCKNLEDASQFKISTTQTVNLLDIFADCSSLKTVPIIPQNVTDLYSAFSGCTSLEGTIEINTTTIAPDNIDCLDYCFEDVDMSKITLSGNASEAFKMALAQTGLNANQVTIVN